MYLTTLFISGSQGLTTRRTLGWATLTTLEYPPVWLVDELNHSSKLGIDWLNYPSDGWLASLTTH